MSGKMNLQRECPGGFAKTEILSRNMITSGKHKDRIALTKIL